MIIRAEFWLLGSVPLCFLTAIPTTAYDFSLVCKNPRREYQVVYDAGSSAVVSNPQSEAFEQPVLATIMDDRQHLIVLNIGQPNMVSVLHLRPYEKVDIYSSGELVQTDACHRQ